MTSRRASRRVFRGLVAATTALLLSPLGCDANGPSSFTVRFSVSSDEDTPVAGAQISARGRPLGVTDAAGRLEARLPGIEGEPVSVAVRCPPGYTSGKPDPVVIPVSPPGLGGKEGLPIRHRLACHPNKRDAVVLVHVAGEVAELPVKIDGQTVGKTDGLGFAHFHLHSTPGSRFEVQLDTSSNDELVPQNPKQSFEVAKNDDLVVFEKSFALAPKPKARRRRHGKKKHRKKKKKPKAYLRKTLN